MSEPRCAPDCAQRAACDKAGQLGHMQCGLCPKHVMPNHHCGCIRLEPIGAPDA